MEFVKLKERKSFFCPLGMQRNNPADAPAMKSVWNKLKKENTPNNNNLLYIQQKQDGIIMRMKMTVRPQEEDNYSLRAESGRDSEVNKHERAAWR